MVHHWIGIIFIPGVTLAQLLPIVQDYDRRAELYKPEVAASHVISHQGNDYRFFLRLYQKRFTTAAIAAMRQLSERVAEVERQSASAFEYFSSAENPVEGKVQ